MFKKNCKYYLENAWFKILDQNLNRKTNERPYTMYFAAQQLNITNPKFIECYKEH